MKNLYHKLITVVALSAATVFCAHAQGIQFEVSSFEEAAEKAVRENKYLFVDCYAVWCGPCKKLSRDVFPNDTVGKFFNSHCVSLKMNVEGEEGRRIAKTYKVKALPTLLFIDPQTKETLNSITGYVEAQRLIEEAEKALDFTRNLKGSSLQYYANKQDAEAALRYLNALNAALMKEERDSVLRDYLFNLSDAERYSEKNWQILANHVESIYAPSFDYLRKNVHGFQKTVGNTQIEQKMENLYKYAILSFIRRKRIPVNEFPQTNFDKLTALLQEYDGPNAAYYRAQVSLVSHVQQEDYGGMLQALDQADKQGVLAPDVRFYFIWLNLTYLRECRDVKVIDCGLKWAEKLKPKAEDIDATRIWLRMKASLYAAKGDSNMQDKLNKEADQLQ